MDVYFHKIQTLFKHNDWLKGSLIPYSREATNFTYWQTDRQTQLAWAESDLHNSWNVGETDLPATWWPNPDSSEPVTDETVVLKCALMEGLNPEHRDAAALCSVQRSTAPARFHGLKFLLCIWEVRVSELGCP